MWPVRVNEPKDPVLWSVSKVVPDRWLDEQWPVRRYLGMTRWKEWHTSQWVRLHLLVLLKGVGSFNRVCRELRHQTDWRRFCRMSSDSASPAPGTLSKFRTDFGLEGWRRLHRFLLGKLLPTLGGSVVGVYVVDSTDLPAAVRRTWKKKTTLLPPSARDRWARDEAVGRRSLGNQTTSWGTRSTRSAFLPA